MANMTVSNKGNHNDIEGLTCNRQNEHILGSTRTSTKYMRVAARIPEIHLRIPETSGTATDLHSWAHSVLASATCGSRLLRAGGLRPAQLDTSVHTPLASIFFVRPSSAVHCTSAADVRPSATSSQFSSACQRRGARWLLSTLCVRQ